MFVGALVGGSKCDTVPVLYKFGCGFVRAQDVQADIQHACVANSKLKILINLTGWNTMTPVTASLCTKFGRSLKRGGSN